MLSHEEIKKIEKIIKPMLGQKAYNARIGQGSFINMDFGQFMPEKNRGEWYIWVYCCAWRVEHDNEVVAASEDGRERMESAIQKVNGKILKSIKISPAMDAEFLFEDNLFIRLFSIYSDPQDETEHWMLFTPENYVLAAGPGMNWTFESADK